MKARENPFASEKVEAIRYAIDPTELSGLRDQLASHGGRGVILGPEGTGKSTLMEDMYRGLCSGPDSQPSAWFQLTVEHSMADRMQTARTIWRQAQVQWIFLDGGEVLPRPFWWLMRRRRCRGFVATVHRDCGLPVLWETAPSLELALRLVHRLDPEGLCPDTLVKDAFHKSGGNVREVFRACYLHCAGIRPVVIPTSGPAASRV